ncbi:MAG: bifunctional biotin--[acetyl-CoA-carboxylase] ligase/biotin operon repressor BirA [Gammaproteobacteria bacterium]|nr:bifunctional biotin--[acetyl-CoA-carboxylase] ligase/biotin operon repressor BirA [Gammaproteobacteria bacterium]
MAFELIRRLADGRFVSGEELGQALGIGRAAVWKRLKNLENYGLEVHAVQGKGYRLSEPLELLDQTRITEHLTPQAQQAIGKWHLLEEIDSTNAYLLKRPLPGVLQVALAEHQTQGRGRRGRPWISPLGRNIYLSLSWTLDGGINQAEGLSLVVGMAVARTLGRLGLMDAGIKWPNDIHWQQKKLGGILLEMAGEAGGPCRLVVGVGLNVKMAEGQDQQIDQPWVDLATITMGQPPSRNKLAAMLLNALIEVLQEYQQHGMAKFLVEWRRYDLVSGREVSLHLPDRVVTGYAQGIDETGALLVRTEQGVQRFVSGEVSLRY